MLTTKMINPQIAAALALCGHGDKILIADGNYPLDSKTGDSKKVYLGLTPGMPSVTDVLSALLSVIKVEKAEVMDPGDGSTPEIFAEFPKILGSDVPIEVIEHQAYYEACEQKAVRLSISTGEKRTYANILLTVGVA